MSFCKTNTLIKEGDTAIVYCSFNQLYPIQIKRGLSHHTKYGSLKHTELIGRRYGSKFKCSQGTVYVIQGSPEIWTICLPHRTQILYTPNISIITLELELKPGSVVVESGTGSASLSHALIRTIYPTGHLHTFEFHQQRSETARKEFLDHGLAEYATVYHRDVCNDGFKLENVADAVFLDLPSPWKALVSAKQALKLEGGRICSFSPCIEQVQKTVLELTQLGFTDIHTIESLRRVLCVKKYAIPEFDFEHDVRDHQRTTERPIRTKVKKETNLEIVDNDDDDDYVPEGNEDDEEEENGNAKKTGSKKTPIKIDFKRKNKKNNRSKKRKDNKDGNESNMESDDNDDDEEDGDRPAVVKYAAKAINSQPGHTGFLTFATLLHKEYQKK